MYIPSKRLTSYDGESVWSHVRIARDVEDLRTHLAEAERRGWKVSIRSGQMSFDSQALNTGMVIQLQSFDAIGDVTPEGTITVGAHATWGAILEVTRRAGYVPYAMASTERATAGGTLSADCLSRFSPSCGKEGNHVARVRLMTVDGSIAYCSRTENPELFRGMISGFGFVGIALEITHELLKVGFSDIVVKTEFTQFTGLAGLAHALVTKVDARPLLETTPAPSRMNKKAAATDMEAISAVVYLSGGRGGFVMHSRYVDGASHPLAPSPFHQPKSLVQRALQLLAYFGPARAIGYIYLRDVYLPRHPHAVDTLEGFTFFQGGNDAVMRRGRALGIPMGIRQQTWVVPMVADDPEQTKQKLAQFLEQTDALLDARGLLPPLIDVLFLPDDSGEGFVLSSNRGISGYAVTVTFEAPFRTEFPDEELACHEISRICAAMGGRVHLVKNVFADCAALEIMYAEGISELRALKAKVDPSHALSNGFLRRIAPSLFSA